MATSAVEIANLALSLLGEGEITSLTQANSEPARLCNLNYAPLRDELLRARPWNFALTRATLAKNASAPAFEYDHAYALPSDPFCLRAVKIWADGAFTHDFRIEGRNLLTDHDPVSLVYVARIDDPSVFDPLFTQALAHLLAARIAYPLTRRDSLHQRLAQEAERFVIEADIADANETVTDPIPASALVTERS